jgi:hypothetical protein
MRREGEGEPYKFPGPDYVAYVFVFLGHYCRLYKLTLSDQAQVTGHSATDCQSLRLNVKIFRRSALAGGAIKFFHRGTNLLLAALLGHCSTV